MYRYDRLNGAAMTEAIFETEWGCKDDGKAGVVDVMEVDLKWFDWQMGIWSCLSKPPIRLWLFTSFNSTQPNVDLSLVHRPICG